MAAYPDPFTAWPKRGRTRDALRELPAALMKSSSGCSRAGLQQMGFTTLEECGQSSYEFLAHVDRSRVSSPSYRGPPADGPRSKDLTVCEVGVVPAQGKASRGLIRVRPNNRNIGKYSVWFVASALRIRTNRSSENGSVSSSPQSLKFSNSRRGIVNTQMVSSQKSFC
jgi:hypothetical protein